MTEPTETTPAGASRSKRATIAGILVLLAVWPVAHRVLVARYDMNPWKFFGWAMYCRAPGTIGLEIRSPSAASASVAVPLGWERRTERFLYWRKHAGALVSPADLGKTLLELNPELQEIEIEVTHTRLDASSARIASRVFDYRYTRSGPP